jgi:hypothetical protein
MRPKANFAVRDRLASAGLKAGSMVILWCGLAANGFVAQAAGDGAIRVTNPSSLERGVDRVTLQELWRVGGEEDPDFLFGSIGDVIAADDGTLYVLDSQLCQVNVISSAGDFVGTLSREGDGPGEVRRPVGVVLMPDGTLGIYQRFPGKVVLVDRDDHPAGSIIPGGDRTEGGFSGIQALECRAGRIVCSGTKMTPGDQSMNRTAYLASLAEDGRELVRYLEATREVDFSRREFIEKDNYFVDAERWALGPDGRVYAAPDRERYLIEVHAADGTLERVIQREFEPYHRTQQEKEDVASRVVAVVNGQRVQLDTKIEDTEPAIASLRVDHGGNLWVEHSWSGRDQPEGVMLTFDVFDPQGALARQVAVVCDGDAQEDELFFTATDRVVLVKGFQQARRAMFGGRGGDSNEDEPDAELQIVCYRFAN